SAMLSLLPVLLNDGRNRGFATTRFIADMAWVMSDPGALDRLLEYECRVNLVLPTAGDIVICSYDLDKFGAEIVIDALRTHPVVLEEFLGADTMPARQGFVSTYGKAIHICASDSRHE